MPIAAWYSKLILLRIFPARLQLACFVAPVNLNLSGADSRIDSKTIRVDQGSSAMC
jgi:hypothetical protein